jgi:hypothetical protein
MGPRSIRDHSRGLEHRHPRRRCRGSIQQLGRCSQGWSRKCSRLLPPGGVCCRHLDEDRSAPVGRNASELGARRHGDVARRSPRGAFSVQCSHAESGAHQGLRQCCGQDVRKCEWATVTRQSRLPTLAQLAILQVLPAARVRRSLSRAASIQSR